MKSTICDPSQQNRAVVCYQEKCDIPFIWKSILLTQRWYHSYVNWMQHCNFMVKNKSYFLFIFFVFSHTNGVISWNAFYRQLPCFDVMGHIFSLLFSSLYNYHYHYHLKCLFMLKYFRFCTKLKSTDLHQYRYPVAEPSVSGMVFCFNLRVRAFFHETVRVRHVYCNFKIGFTCRITAIFGTLKGGSLLINTLASNICFSYRNMFQNGVDALSKIVDAFLSKSSKFHLVRIIR